MGYFPITKKKENKILSLALFERVMGIVLAYYDILNNNF